jgi:hypothetical protein
VLLAKEANTVEHLSRAAASLFEACFQIRILALEFFYPLRTRRVAPGDDSSCFTRASAFMARARNDASSSPRWRTNRSRSVNADSSSACSLSDAKFRLQGF